MKAKELKVGDSFEVVEVLKNLGFNYLKGMQGIAIPSSSYKNGVDFIIFDEMYDGQYVFPYLYHEEVKSIGKLTITKLK